MRTREAIVRRELLLREGDAYDSVLAQESERNLRALQVFGGVLVRPHFVTDSTMDLLLETTDQWTTEGSLRLGGGGGAYQFSLGVEEKNFLGRGQKVELTYEKSDLRVKRSASFYDRRFLALPASLFLVGETRSDGHYYLMETARPLYSSKDKWGLGLHMLSSSDRLRFFEGGEERFFFRLKTKEMGASAQRSWGKLFKRVGSLGYSITQNTSKGPFYFSLADTLFKPGQFGYTAPEPRVHAFSGGLSLYFNRYAEERYLDNFGNVEDVRTGETAAFEYVMALKLFGSSLTRHEAAVSAGTTRKTGQHFLHTSLGNRTTFLADRWEGTLWEGRWRYYWQWKEKQTAALRLDVSSLTGEARIGQFVLGGESGLRGYDARSFSGSRVVLGTMEQRIFGPNLFSLLGLGGVAFVDVGEAWKKGEDFKISELKSDWGVGLRLGLVKSSQFRIVRLDWARPFGPGGWVFSFGTGMSFELQ